MSTVEQGIGSYKLITICLIFICKASFYKGINPARDFEPGLGFKFSYAQIFSMWSGLSCFTFLPSWNPVKTFLLSQFTHFLKHSIKHLLSQTISWYSPPRHSVHFGDVRKTKQRRFTLIGQRLQCLWKSLPNWTAVVMFALRSDVLFLIVFL